MGGSAMSGTPTTTGCAAVKGVVMADLSVGVARLWSLRLPLRAWAGSPVTAIAAFLAILVGTVRGLVMGFATHVEGSFC